MFFLDSIVATVPTVYGIETQLPNRYPFRYETRLQQYLPFTVLKLEEHVINGNFRKVATVPTVYGIETIIFFLFFIITIRLQQYLPFTVLKRNCQECSC